MYRRILASLIVFISLFLCAEAQELSVGAIQPVRSSIKARTAQVHDNNGDLCALLEIAAPSLEGVVFDNNKVVGEVSYSAGVYSVFVPPGIKKLGFRHVDYVPGVIDFDAAGIKVESGETYFVPLQKPSIGELQYQFLVVNVTPASALVEVDGQALIVNNGTAQMLLPVGSAHHYRVSANGMYAEEGTVIIDSYDERKTLDVSLKSNTSKVHIISVPDARIIVNGSALGSGEWTGDLTPGIYRIEAFKSETLISNEIHDIALTEGVIDIELGILYGTLTVTSSEPNATVCLDDKPVGKTPLVIRRVIPGPHSVTISMGGFNMASIDTVVNSSCNLDLDIPLIQESNIDEKEKRALLPEKQVCNDFLPKILSFARQSFDGYYRSFSPFSIGWIEINRDYAEKNVMDSLFQDYGSYSALDIAMCDTTRFFARIGAGGSFHPEGVVYLHPSMGPKFTLSVYDRFKGYWGNYVDINDREDPYYGIDMSNVAGLGVRFNADKFVVSLDGDFDWIRTRELLFDGNNVLKGGGKIGIESVNTKHFFYGLSAHYSSLKNTVNNYFVSSDDGTEASPAVFAEDNMGGDFKAGVRIGRKHSLAVDAKFDRYVFGDPVTNYASSNDVFSVTPSYSFIFKRGSISIGATYADVLKDDVYFNPETPDNIDYLVMNFYPDVNVSFEVVRDALVISAKFTGGLKFNSYGSYLEDNHHFNSSLSSRYPSSLGQASVNTFDAALGFSGRATNHFQYNVEAGYARWYHAPLDGVIESSGSHFYYVSMTNYDIAYADIDAAFLGDSFNASAHFRIQDAALKSVSYALTLPRFVCDAMVEYNWNHRIFAGVNAEWMSVRRYGFGQMAIDPTYHYTAYGWLDLGVQVEYKFAGKFSVWAKGCNLLNQEVMRNCMYAEKGPYFTLGICTSL